MRFTLLLFVIALAANTSWASYHVLVTDREHDISEQQDWSLLHSRSKRYLDPDDILDSLVDDYDEGGSGSNDVAFSREQTLQFFVKNPDQKSSARATLSDAIPGDAILTDFNIHNHEKTYRFDENKALGKDEAIAEFQNSAESGRSAIMIGDIQTVNSRCSDCRFNSDESSSVTAVITIAPGDVLSVSVSFVVPLPADSTEYLKDLYRTDAAIEVDASTTNFTGVLMSPNYPNPYPNNADITWLIRFAASDRVVSASLMSFESESCCDHLYIYDGETDTAPLLEVISGETYSSNPILSTSSSMLIKFQSDYNGNDGEFSLEFTAASPAPPEVNDPDKLPTNQTFDVYGNDGAVYSPGYPLSYPPSSTLTWIVTSDKDSSLSFQIIDFDVNAGESLSIYDDLSGSNLITITSASTIPFRSPIVSSGNRALVFFSSTEIIIPKCGFYVTFHSNPLADSCFHNISLAKDDEEKILVSPNYPANYGDNELCTWILNVRSPNLIIIEVENLNLESGFDTLSIYDGTLTNPMATLSGTGGKNLQYATTSSTATLVFKSDQSQTDAGFQIKYRNFRVLNSCYGGSQTQEIVSTKEGLITNPKFPSMNKAYGECTWLITVSNDRIITFHLDYFYIDYAYNDGSITFYDGNSNQNDVLWSGRYSDYKNSRVFLSTSNTAFVHFRCPDHNYRYAFRFYETYQDYTCGTTLVSSPGIIKSPNYPHYFPKNTYCDWLIQAPPGDVIILYIEKLVYDYHYNFITFYDGNTSASSILLECKSSTRCHSEWTTTSSSNFIFINSSSTTNSGFFKFRYTFSSDSDSLINRFDDYSGYAISPNFPNDYPNWYGHTYEIKVPSGSIQFNFITFQTEQCCDYLTLYDGNSTSSSPQITTLRGSQDGYFGQTSSNSLSMHFYTDGSSTSAGFRMNYCGTNGADICDLNVTPNEVTTTAYSYQKNQYHFYSFYPVSFLSPRVLGYYPPNVDFYWYMDCRSLSNRVKYYFVHIDIDSSDFVKIYDGFGTESANLLSTISNYVLSGSEYSFSSKTATTTVWFHSDSKYSGEGFLGRYDCY